MKMTGCDRRYAEEAGREPNLTDVLNDPVVRAVMRADGVDPDQLAGILGFVIRGRSTTQLSGVAPRTKHKGRTLPAVGAVLLGLMDFGQSNSADATHGGVGGGFHGGGFAGVGGFHGGGFAGAGGFHGGGPSLTVGIMTGDLQQPSRETGVTPLRSSAGTLPQSGCVRATAYHPGCLMRANRWH